MRLQAAPTSLSHGVLCARGLKPIYRHQLHCSAFLKKNASGQQPQDDKQPDQLPSRLRRWLAGTAAATAASTAAALAGLLPAGVASAIDGLGPYDAALDPLDAELLDASTPELMEVMFIVVATYFGLMVLYLWLASIIDEEPASGSDVRSTHSQSSSFEDNPQQQQQQQQRRQQQQQQSSEALPPSYARYLHAHIRSVREPKRGHELVAPSSEAGGAGAYACGVSGLKEALSVQAADFVSQQIRECGSVVRRQLYLRRLAAREGVGKLPHASKRGPTSIALLLGQPGEMEHLVEQCLDNLPADMLDGSSEESMVRGISGVVARRLAAAEAGELIRSMQAAMKQRAKEETFNFEMW